MPFLGMQTVGDLSEQELARIGREAIERTLRGPQGIPTSAQRDFAMQVYNQIAPQLTPESLSQFGSFVQPYFQATAGTRPTYATLQQARPLFLSQLEATGGDESAVSPWLRSVAQPLQDRGGLTAGAALNERAWQQAIEGLGGWVRDPETGQLVPTAETQRAMALAYLSSLGQTDGGLSQLLGGWYGQTGAGTGIATGAASGSPSSPQMQLSIPEGIGTSAGLGESAKAALTSGGSQSKIIQSAADAANRASQGVETTGPNWQTPGFWQQLGASLLPGGVDRLAPSQEVVQQLQQEFATPREAYNAVDQALRQAQSQPNIDPQLIQILQTLREWLQLKVIPLDPLDWRTYVPFAQGAW